METPSPKKGGETPDWCTILYYSFSILLLKKCLQRQGPHQAVSMKNAYGYKICASDINHLVILFYRVIVLQYDFKQIFMCDLWSKHLIFITFGWLLYDNVMDVLLFIGDHRLTKCCLHCITISAKPNHCE